MGVLLWSEAQFWDCSLRGWDRAVAGWRKSNGVGKAPGMTRARLNELKAQFPDNVTHA